MDMIKKSILLCGISLMALTANADEKKSFGTFLADEYKDSLWSASGKELMNGPNKYVMNLVWKNTFGRLFGDKGPDQYMIALHDIQATLDRIDAKTDTLIGITQVTFAEIQSFHTEYQENELKNKVDALMLLPQNVNQKAGEVFLPPYSSNKDEPRKPFVDMNQYMSADDEIDTDALFDMARNACALNQAGVVKCSTFARNTFAKLDGKVPTENRLDGDDVLLNTPTKVLGGSIDEPKYISDFVTQYAHIGFSDETSIQTLFKNTNQGLVGVLGTGELGEKASIPVKIGTTDVTSKWFAVTSINQSLATRYYTSLYSLYQLQAAQLQGKRI